MPGLLAFYSSLLFVYGLMVWAADGWLEQVVKRGWTGQELPNVLVPKLSLAWAGVIAASFLVYGLWSGPTRWRRRESALPSPVAQDQGAENRQRLPPA